LYNYIKENRLKVLVIPLVVYWILLFVGTTLPSAKYANFFDISDKIKHFSAYSILAILLGLNLYFQEKWKNVSKFHLNYTFIICGLYGILDELHQLFVPNRSAEVLDWVADIGGTILGIILVRFFIKVMKKNITFVETR
jgi:VanZ family protein